jgi:DNA-binding MarR family transcriptional regulator
VARRGPRVPGAPADGGLTDHGLTDDEPRLDLPDGGLLGAIVSLNLAVSEVLEEIAARSGLTFSDYLVLGVVRRSSGGRSSPTAIARVLGRTTGGMSLTLDRLESARLLRRRPDPGDGRRVVVELTPTGTDLATRVNRALHTWEAALDLDGAGVETVTMLDWVRVAVARGQAAPPVRSGA